MTKYKIIFALCFVILLIGIVSANLGCFKPNENFDIVTNSNSSAINITEIQSPSPSPQLLVRNVAMTKIGKSFNYTFSNSKIGVYSYGFCDLEGNCYSNTFEITSSGRCGSSSNIVFIIFMILIVYALTFIGLFTRNATLTTLGGGFMMFLGIYLMNNGIIIYRDDLTTYFSYVTIFLGAALAIWAGIELIQENLD